MFSRVLKKNLRKDDECGRIGGDEFVVLFESPAADVCDRSIRALEDYMKEYNKGDSKFTLSASAGYAYSNELNGAPIEDVYYLADTRMYKMKEAHHNA